MYLVDQNSSECRKRLKVREFLLLLINFSVVINSQSIPCRQQGHELLKYTNGAVNSFRFIQ